MGRKVLFTASTYSHIVNFHLPYLRRFQEEGWTVHAACGGRAMPIPYADQVVGLPLEKSMGSPKNVQAAAVLREIIRTAITIYLSLLTERWKFSWKIRPIPSKRMRCFSWTA